MLAFVESPSSLSLSSDITMDKSFLVKYEFPCGILEAVDLFCLFVFLIDVCVKVTNKLNL